MTTGAAFMFGFGIVWLLIGILRGRGRPSGSGIRCTRGHRFGCIDRDHGHAGVTMLPSATPPTVQQIAANREIGRHFYGLIFGAELAAIVLAVVVLNARHYPNHILCAIALIVGVHFFPLAPLFKLPVYYATGLLGCAIGVAGFFVADDRLRQEVVGLSFGFLLWATAAWILWLGIRCAATS
jgi:hypothetical protein